MVTITVDVATADTTVEVAAPGQGTRSLRVLPGSRVWITLGRGGRNGALQVEVGAP